VFLPEAPLRLGGAERGERRAPKGGAAPLAEVPHQGGILVPFQLEKPNFSSLPCA